MVEGKRMRLEYDQANAAQGHKDNTQQKRTLAYVFLEDGTLLNAGILLRPYSFFLVGAGCWDHAACHCEDCTEAVRAVKTVHD
jgi:hypothetical protein